MGAQQPAPAPLSAAHAAFVAGDHSIVAASRSADRTPSLARSLGCRVSADRRSVLLLFHPRQAAELLADVAGCGRIAVVFSEPTTHKTLQLKGSDARLVTPPADAAALAERHVGGFAGVVGGLGFRADLVRTVLAGEPAPLAAVEFSPDAAFEQTPGPQAGARLP